MSWDPTGNVDNRTDMRLREAISDQIFEESHQPSKVVGALRDGTFNEEFNPEGIETYGLPEEVVVGEEYSLRAALARRRLLARWYDLMIHFIVSFVIMMVVILASGLTVDTDQLMPLILLLSFVAWALHEIIGVAFFGKTLGKHWADLRIAERKHAVQIGLWRSFRRFLLPGLCVLSLLTGLGFILIPILFLTIPWTDQKRGLHDKLGGTAVIDMRYLGLPTDEAMETLMTPPTATPSSAGENPATTPAIPPPASSLPPPPPLPATVNEPPPPPAMAPSSQSPMPESAPLVPGAVMPGATSPAASSVGYSYQSDSVTQPVSTSTGADPTDQFDPSNNPITKEQSVTTLPPPPPQPSGSTTPPPTWSDHSPTVAQQSSSNTDYATLGTGASVELASINQRIGARAIDYAIYFAVWCVDFTFQVGLQTGNISFLTILVFLVYEPLMTMKFGGSVGKMATKIRVVEASTGTTPSFNRSLGRWVIVWASWFVALGWLVHLSAVWGKKRQGWVDMAAKTYVIRTPN